jgi:hypothetical protein
MVFSGMAFMKWIIPAILTILLIWLASYSLGQKAAYTHLAAIQATRCEQADWLCLITWANERKRK